MRFMVSLLEELPFHFQPYPNQSYFLLYNFLHLSYFLLVQMHV